MKAVERLFLQKDSLKKCIIAVREKVKDFTCKVCVKSFSQKAHREGHIRAVNEKIKNLKCEECGKCFSFKHY